MVHRECFSHQGNLCIVQSVGTSLSMESFLFSRVGWHYITLTNQTGPMMVEKLYAIFHFLELRNPLCVILLLLCSLGKETSFLLALNNRLIIQVLYNILQRNKPTIHSSSTPSLDL